MANNSAFVSDSSKLTAHNAPKVEVNDEHKDDKAVFTSNLEAHPKAQSDVLVVCFDADLTLFKGHLFHFLNGNYEPKYFENKPNDARILFKKFIESNTNWGVGFKNQAGTVNAIRTALHNGHKVAITSYTLYPNILPIALEEMGLSQEEISNIPIVGGFPNQSGELCYDIDRPVNSHGKQRHIEQAKKALANIYQQDFTDNRAVLVDDTRNNVTIANQNGDIGIQVDPKSDNDDYLKKLNQHISPPGCSPILLFAMNHPVATGAILGTLAACIVITSLFTFGASGAIAAGVGLSVGASMATVSTLCLFTGVGIGAGVGLAIDKFQNKEELVNSPPSMSITGS